jgi:rhodanese-related sulfurtransferase
MNKIRILILMFALPLIPAALNAWLNPMAPPWNAMQLAEGEITLQHLLDWEDDYILVDARASENYATGHMPQAINVSGSEFDTQMMPLLDQWTPERPVVVYCDSRQCGSSAEIAARLRQDFQMDKVFVLKGGWESWIEASTDIQEILGGER